MSSKYWEVRRAAPLFSHRCQDCKPSVVIKSLICVLRTNAEESPSRLCDERGGGHRRPLRWVRLMNVGRRKTSSQQQNSGLGSWTGGPRVALGHG